MEDSQLVIVIKSCFGNDSRFNFEEKDSDLHMLISGILHNDLQRQGILNVSKDAIHYFETSYTHDMKVRVEEYIQNNIKSLKINNNVLYASMCGVPVPILFGFVNTVLLIK